MIEEMDRIILSAGLDNVAAFLSNVEMALRQEFESLKSAAADGQPILYCPQCHVPLFGVDARLEHGMGTQGQYILYVECPKCKEPLEIDVALGNARGLPF